MARRGRAAPRPRVDLIWNPERVPSLPRWLVAAEPLLAHASNVAKLQTMSDVEKQVAAFRQDLGRLRTEIARVIVGHEEVVEGTLLALVAGGHVLIEGVPGL